MEVLGKHKSKFGQDFSDNKKALDEVTIIRSKGLKNEIAGYITKHIKHEVHDNELRHAQAVEEEQAVAEAEVEEVSEESVEAVEESIEETTESTEESAPETTETSTETPAQEPEPEQTA